jgi:hypothetical protein
MKGNKMAEETINEEQVEILDEGQSEQTATDIMVAQAADVAVAEEDDSMLIDLPTFEDVSDAVINKNMKVVFPGYCVNDGNQELDFDTAEQIAEYADKTFKELDTVTKTSDAVMRLHNAAVAARFRDTCENIDNNMSKKDYGKATYNLLAARLGHSVPWVYQLRAVAKRLTRRECHLLGIRNISRTCIRDCAKIKDDDRRHLLIKTFVEETAGGKTRKELEALERKFRAAVTDAVNGSDVDVAATSDPKALEEGPKVTEEYDALMEAFSTLKKALKIIGDEETMTTISEAMRNFYLMDSYPEAEKLMGSVHSDAEYLSKKFTEVSNDYIAQLIQDLDSVAHTQLQASEA